MSEKALFLHVGMHKTATTALQAFFAQNSHVFKKNGVLYPVTGLTGWGSHHHFVSSIKKPYDPNVPPYNTYEGYLQELEKEAQGSDTVLMSSEIFSEAIDRPRLRALGNIFDIVNIVIYLRPQHSYLESYYNEKVKDGDYTGTIDELAKSLDLDYYQVCEEWSTLFGRENIIVRPFEQNQFVNKDIFSDFLSILGLSLNNDYVSIKKMLNSSLKRDALEFKRITNYLPLSDSDVRDIGNIALKRYSAECKSDAFSELLSPEKRLAIMQQYELSNARVTSDYLGRKNGQLFCDSLPALGASWQHYSGLTDCIIKDISSFMEKETPEVFQSFGKAVIAGLRSEQAEVYSAASKLIPGLELIFEIYSDAKNLSIDYQREFYSIINSRSWRFTAPLRRIGSFIRRIMR